MDELEDVWNNLHDAVTALGWYVGRPSHREKLGVWERYAFDPEERPRVGHRTRTIVPIAYIAWSRWLIALGVAFLLV